MKDMFMVKVFSLSLGTYSHKNEKMLYTQTVVEGAVFSF